MPRIAPFAVLVFLVGCKSGTSTETTETPTVKGKIINKIDVPLPKLAGGWHEYSAVKFGVAMMVPPMFEPYTPQGYLGAVSSVDPSIGGASMPVDNDSLVHAYCTDNAAIQAMIATEITLKKYRNLGGTLEGYVSKMEKEAIDYGWKRLPNVETPLGTAVIFELKKDENNMKGVVTPVTYQRYIWATATEAFQVRISAPTSLWPRMYPNLRIAALSFRIVTPNPSAEIIKPAETNWKNKFGIQPPVDPQEAQQRREEMQNRMNGRDPYRPGGMPAPPEVQPPDPQNQNPPPTDPSQTGGQ